MADCKYCKMHEGSCTVYIICPDGERNVFVNAFAC